MKKIICALATAIISGGLTLAGTGIPLGNSPAVEATGCETPYKVGVDDLYVFKGTQGGTIIIPDTVKARILVVGGGGAGRKGMGGGGGSAGQVVEELEIELTAGTYAITVGAGGTDSTASGGASSFGELTANGGAGGVSSGYYGGPGGKGAGGNGGVVTSYDMDGGNGGAAVANDITGELKAYAGGGAGGFSQNSHQGGKGGGVEIDGVFVRVGGNGGSGQWGSGGAGENGTGSGGGGGASGVGAGGSGIVVVRILNFCDHSVITHLSQVDPTCSAKGLVECDQCDICNLFLYGGEALSVRPTIDEIPHPEHLYEDVSLIRPTCREEGRTAGVKCGVCGAVVSGCGPLPRTDHRFGVDGYCVTCPADDRAQGEPAARLKGVIVWGARAEMLPGDEVVLTYTNLAQTCWLTLPSMVKARILVVGGGAAGGQGNGSYGGHAGRLVETNRLVLAAGVYAIRVGAGGKDAGESGAPSSFGSENGVMSIVGDGGVGRTGSAGNYGPGGDGAGGVGSAGNAGGHGGPAVKSDITGEWKAYAGGGAGCNQYAAAENRPRGGGVEIDGTFVLVGGDGGYVGQQYFAGAGARGTGSGGGGGANAKGAGGSGTVILRFRLPSGFAVILR